MRPASLWLSSPLAHAPKRQDDREDDPERRQPDIEQARHVLVWQPQISPEEGLARTIA